MPDVDYKLSAWTWKRMELLYEDTSATPNAYDAVLIFMWFRAI